MVPKIAVIRTKGWSIYYSQTGNVNSGLFFLIMWTNLDGKCWVINMLTVSNSRTFIQIGLHLFVLVFVLRLYTIVWTFCNLMFSLRPLPSENTDNIITKTYLSLSIIIISGHYTLVVFLSIQFTNIFSDCCMLHGTKEMPLFPLGLLPCSMRLREISKW